MVGMGYRLVSRDAKTLGAEVVSDVLDMLADAHQRLAEGQGAEDLERMRRLERRPGHLL